MTEPPVAIPPNPAWGSTAHSGWSIGPAPPTGNFGPIVSMDPYGHLVPTVFRREIDAGLDVRPSIAVTRAHMKMSELDDAARRGDIVVDGKIVLASRALPALAGAPPGEPGVEVNVSKAAVEPVWHLPGVAERFGMYVQHAVFCSMVLIAVCIM
jgi:hypothetical protein